MSRHKVPKYVADYIEKYYSTIVNDMNTSQNETSEKDKGKGKAVRKASNASLNERKTRQELSKSHMYNMSLAKGSRMVSFD